MNNYSNIPRRADSDSSQSMHERYLTDKHGDLHKHIPPLLENRSQAQVAAMLSDHVVTVTQAWLSYWLRGNNAEGIVYRQQSRWLPVEDAS